MRDFIIARLNKDNFWNLMFFVIMVSGIATAFATNIMILSWFTIIGSIWLIKRNSDIVFNAKKLHFTVNNNKDIKASGAEFIIVMFATLGIMAIIGFTLDNLKIDDSPFILGIMMSILVLFPVKYCILRNIPISVYFKKEAWTKEQNSSSYNRRNKNNHNKPLLGAERMMTDPANKSFSGNIYYRR